MRVDQRMPVENENISCQETLRNHIVHDLNDSEARGIETYGTALQPFNRRNALRDAYEEWIDLGIYLEQIKTERQAMIDFLRKVSTWELSDLREIASDLLTGMGEE